MSSRFRCFIRSLAVCPLLLFCAAGLVAQMTTADVVGTVTDNSGAVLVGARVTVKNLGTEVARSMVTNDTGNYVFTFLPVGTYSVTIEVEGFKRVTTPSLILAAGDRARLDAKMELGDVKQVVDVGGGAVAALQTDSSTIGGLVTTQAVQDLPVNGRNFMKLVQLAPGANEGPVNSLSGGSRPDDRRQTSAIVVNGQTDDVNNYMIDGMDNNERLIGTIGVKPSIDALDEVKIQTNLYTADLGRTAGGVINMITKSGANKFHGTLFEFVRNDKFDAKDFFNTPQAGNPIAGLKPEYRQNQFGGSLGGAIKKNKIFFFGDYEGLRIVQGQTGSATLPTPCELGRAACNGVTQLGNFSDLLPSKVIYDVTTNPTTPFPNNIIPLNRINSISKKFAALIPAPSSSSCSATSLTCLFVNNPVRRQSGNTFDTRIDNHFSDKDFLYGRYSFNNTYTFVPGLLPEVSNAWPGGALTSTSYVGPSWQREQHMALSYVHVFRPNLLLQLNAAYLRAVTGTYPLNFGNNVMNTFGFPGLNTDSLTSGMANVVFNDGGYVGLGDPPYLPLLYWDNTFQYTGAVTWTRGAHTIKFGGALVRRRVDNFQSQFGKGTFQFGSQQTNSTAGGSGATGGNSFASFLLGDVYGERRLMQMATQEYRMWETGAYVQDDWRATSRLTLNIGIRYDIFTPFTDKHNNLSNFDPTVPSVLQGGTVQVAGQNGVGRTVNIPTGYKHFQPRTGFALTLGKGTVIRGGFGMTTFPNNLSGMASLKNQPIISAWIQSAPLGLPGTSLPIFGVGVPPPTPASTCLVASCGAKDITYVPYAMAVDHSDSTAYQYNLMIEKEVGGNILGIGYVGEVSHHLAHVISDVNLPTPPLEPGGCGQTTAVQIPGPCQPYYGQIPLVTYIQLNKTDGRNNYNALQMQFQRRYKNGLTAAANYTYARGLTNTSSPNGTCNGAGGCNLWLANWQKYDYGNSDYDIRHRVTVTATYELPFGKSLKGPAAQVVKGWQINGIYIFSTGLPYTVGNGSNPQSNVGPLVATTTNLTADRPNRLQPASGFTPTLSQWIDTTGFRLQTYGMAGNEGRNAFYSPSQRRFDFSLFKDFPIKESVKLQFRVETFNLTNTPSFAQPGATISGWTSSNAATAVPTQAGNFGKITATSVFYTPRDIQFALKLLF
jgi:hypothetical protein